MKKFIWVLIMAILSASGFSTEFLSQEEVVKIGENNVFKEYDGYLEISSKFAVVPGLKNGFVPQGLAYIKKEDCFVVSAYKDNGYSILTFLDAQNGSMIKSVILCNRDGSYYTGHAGGVAVSVDNLWISSGSKIRKIPLAEIEKAADGEKVLVTEEFPAYTNASFTTYHNGVLWIGEFYHAGDYPTNTDHYLSTENGITNHSWITGFNLGDSPDETPSSVPDYIISIPDIVQGAAFSENTGIVLSRSYGRGYDSELQIYRYVLNETPEGGVEISGKTVPMWVLQQSNLSAGLVNFPMSEGIVLENGILFTLYESAAKKYLMTTKRATEYIWRTELNSIIGE